LTSIRTSSRSSEVDNAILSERPCGCRVRTQQHSYRDTDHVGFAVIVTSSCTPLSVLEAHSGRTRGTSKSNAAALRCGEHGYDGGHAAFIDIESVPKADCPIACNYFVDCRMYAISTDPGHCYMYDTEMADNFVAVESSPYVFYEKACNKTST
jgi:hypothetical protein